MSSSPFTGRLQAARQRLTSLRERSSASVEGDEVLREALEELGNALEELEVACEEIGEQHDELAAARGAIEAERERYRSLFDAAPDAYLVTTPDGVIVEANRAAGALLGVDGRELVGKPLVLYVAEGGRRTFFDLLRCIEAAPETLEVRIELLPRGGPALNAVATVAAVRAVGTGAALGDAREIRWQVRAARVRRGTEGTEGPPPPEAEGRMTAAGASAHGAEDESDILQLVMENTQAQLAYLDDAFRFVRVNAAYARGSGYRREELLGRNHFDLFPDAENRAIFERVRDTGEAISFRAKPFVYPDRPELGTTYWDWRLTPIPGADGKTRGLVFSLLDVTERERLLDLLASERARLHAVIAHAPEAIIVTDERGRIVLVNGVAQEMGFYVGSSARRDESDPAVDRGPARQRIPPLLQAVAAGEPLHDMELSVVCPDGEERCLLVSAVPIRDGAARIIGGVAVLQDVTEWRRTQEALRRYAERLQILHEVDEAVLASHSVDAIASAALRHVWQFVPCLWAAVAMFSEDLNEVALLAALADRETSLMAGWRGPLDWCWFVDELAGGTAHVVEDLAALSRPCPVLDALREQGVRAYLTVPLVAQGRLIGSLNLGMADPGGLVPEHVDVVQEMANNLAIAIHQANLNERVARHAQDLERRVVERTAALRASEARFRTVFEESAVGIALLDMEGHVLDANPALQELLDRALDDLVGEPFTCCIALDGGGQDGESYAALLAGRCDYYRTERPFRRHGGGEAWANVTLSLVRRHGGVPWFAIAMVDDVTDDRAMRAALAEAEKLTLTGRLVASLTHEINNPLQAVMGCLGLAQEALEGGEDPDRFLTMARDELRRTSSIVGHLRSLYRPVQAGEKRPGDIHALIREVLELSRKQVSGRGIHVVTEWGDLPPVPMMADRMRQVVLNLILNAVDAMPDGGRLTITTALTHRPKGVSIAFRDRGVGITEEVLPHIFDSFYTTKEDGLGLGLFITRGIVREHGGTISAVSQPGEGTTFTVWLPLGSGASKCAGGEPITRGEG